MRVGVVWTFLLSSIFPLLFLPLSVWETARYRLKYWSDGAIVLGKLPVPGRPTIWMIVGQGPAALAVGAGGGCLDIFTLVYLSSPLSPSLCLGDGPI